jgi:hypothetical protein
MKIKSILFLIILSLCTGCNKKPPVINNEAEQQKLLHEAFCNDSLPLLRQFFENWHREILPISYNERIKLSGIHQAVYKVYESFCNYDIEKNRNVYESYPYCIAQNEISYEVTSYNNLYESYPKLDIVEKDTVKDFMVLPGGLKTNIVFATPAYKRILKNYLLDTCACIKRNADTSDVSKTSPVNFLQKLVFLRCNMGGYILSSLPLVRIVFNNIQSEAIVYWNGGGTGGSILFVLAYGEWKFKETFVTWIE